MVHSEEYIVTGYFWGAGKMLKLVKISAIFCAAVVLALPCAAKAAPLGTVDIAYTGQGAYDTVSVWAGGYEGITGNAGVYMLDKSGGTGEGTIWPNGPIGSFCIEWAELASSSTLTYKVIMPEDGPLPTSFLGSTMGVTKAKYIEELWGRYFNPAWVGSCAFGSYYNNQAAAFAAALWEIVHEDLPISPLGWDVTVDGTAGSRGFRAEYLDAYTANTWLHSLNGTGPMANLRVFSYNGQQDFIAEVPEPATMALLGLGGMLSLLRRKRRATT
jgi:hypothetical protein